MNGAFVQCIVVIASLTPLCGCTPQAQITPPDPAKSLGVGMRKELTLVANQGWRESGVLLRKGDQIRIAATGRWRCGGLNPWTGPDGIGEGEWFPFVKGYPASSLVARIGQNAPIYIGADKVLNARQDGVLTFAMNDTLPGDNQGEISVTVEILRSAAGGSPAASIARRPVGPVRARQAVVIGISDYKHRGRWRLTNLRYASRDARILQDHLQRNQYDSVTLLTDAQATTRSIRAVLREKLRGVQKDDFVLIFWAGHGCPDPQDPKSLYLVTHDTDPAHMASTAYSMEEFKADIAKLKSDRVLVIADACHSAGIANPKIGTRGDEDNKIVEGMRSVYIADDKAESGGPMRMIFTSCETGEVSRESSELGGGHGVFTWYLLQALTGQADDPKHKTGGNADGNVTLGEMIEYTRDKVKRHTGNQQHPDTAGRFDRNLIMGAAK